MASGGTFDASALHDAFCVPPELETMMTRSKRSLAFFGFVLPVLGSLGCSTGPSDPGGGTDTDVPIEAGTSVALSVSAAVEERKVHLDSALDEVADWDAATFVEWTQVAFEELGYDPSQAAGLDLIENSLLGLTKLEKEKLTENGFVVSDRNTFPTFTYGYSSIYGDDLPLFVSADSMLYALHTSYDNILKAFEGDSLLPELTSYLSGMRANLEDSSLPDTMRSDLDVFLSVANSLLTDELVTPLEPSNLLEVRALYDGCRAAQGSERTSIFGVSRRIDFSQCQPRGHYTDSPALERYFRAMMWLGRIDFRMIETQEDGSSLFHRRQLEAAWALRDLMGEAELASHRSIDEFVTAFVGEHDYMTVAQFDALASDLGISALDELDSKSDQEIAQAIVEGGYGTQRISSHYMVNGVGAETLPLSSSFALFGQRYVLDSHVFSNVVYDRVHVPRLMPNPLDVAHAALGNDQAGMLLAEEMEENDYAAALQSMRVIADSEPREFWERNLYNRWLGALRTLSPAVAMETNEGQNLPTIAKTENWGKRLLNTQLASWAELRHDTILYVKQSYTSGVACEFPDAYVEPYPAFFAELAAYAAHAGQLVDGLGFPAPPGAREHFENFGAVAAILGQMAEHQRTGAPHTDEHMAFINEAVTVEEICGGATADGWYPNMIYGSSVDFEPTIADVHTQPTDAGGNEVGRVLHVGTGDARLMVVTVETCSGPRAYAGLVSSYYERIEEDWKRLTDPEWEDILRQALQPESPAWFTPLLAD